MGDVYGGCVRGMYMRNEYEGCVGDVYEGCV